MPQCPWAGGCRSSGDRWSATWASHRDLGFLQVADSDLIDISAAEMMAPDRVVLVTTGTQGEPMAALSRMSRGEHRSITLTAGDLIVLSSSLIPGNEEAVYGVIDELSKIGARVVTNAQARVHVSGHAYAGELLFLYNGVRPRHVMPVHGTWRMLRANAKLAASTGVAAGVNSVGRERCQRRSGRRQGIGRRCGTGRQDVRRRPDHRRCRRHHPGRTLDPVRGLYRGDRGASTAALDARWLRPHLYSRGFSEDPKALEPAVRKVEAELESLVAAKVTDPIRIAQGVRRTIGKWIGEAYRRQPMIVPTVIEV